MSKVSNPTRSAADAVIESVFDADQRKMLDQCSKFLQNVGAPKIAARALELGYDDAEHTQGWALLRKASGEGRPLTHFVDQADQAALLSGDKLRLALGTIDAFENRWFPIIQTALPRFIDPAHLETFTAAFFKELSQQPEGPGVVRSVSNLIERVESLAQSPTPGARDAFLSLEKRGLNADAIQGVRDLIAQVQQFAPAPAVATADAIAQATAEQRAAFNALSLWYKDWAATFRQSLDYHAQVRLGLAKRRGGRTTDDLQTPQ